MRRIATIAAGNAFLAIELARVASTSGAAPDELSPEALSRSARIKRLAETRVRALPEPTRTALGVVAALGEPPAAVLSRALPDEAVLEAAFDAGVLEQQDDRVRFTHPLLVAGALSSLSPWRRRSIHRTLADLADTAEQRADTSPPRRRSHPPRSRRRSRTVPPARSRAGHPPRRPDCSRMRCASRPRPMAQHWGGGS